MRNKDHKCYENQQLFIIMSTMENDLKNWYYKERYHPPLYTDVNCSMEDIPKPWYLILWTFPLHQGILYLFFHFYLQRIAEELRQFVILSEQEHAALFQHLSLWTPVNSSHPQIPERKIYICQHATECYNQPLCNYHIFFSFFSFLHCTMYTLDVCATIQFLEELLNNIPNCCQAVLNNLFYILAQDTAQTICI